MTGIIFFPGCSTSDVYFNIFAKSFAVRVLVTTVSRLPARGSEIINTSATPLRTYTESTFSGHPGPHGTRVSFISCYLFRRCKPRDATDHMGAGILQGHPPWMQQTPPLPLECTIPSQATVSVRFFHYITYSTACYMIYNFQTDQFICNCLHRP